MQTPPTRRTPSAGRAEDSVPLAPTGEHRGFVPPECGSSCLDTCHMHVFFGVCDGGTLKVPSLALLLKYEYCTFILYRAVRRLSYLKYSSSNVIGHGLVALCWKHGVFDTFFAVCIFSVPSSFARSRFFLYTFLTNKKINKSKKCFVRRLFEYTLEHATCTKSRPKMKFQPRYP